MDRGRCGRSRRVMLQRATPMPDMSAFLHADVWITLATLTALELVLGIEQEFGVKVEDEEMGQEALSSVATLADFVAGKRGA